jgi:broad specificity phosphatase PhoE
MDARHRRTVYIVRHAESRYNVGVKKWSLTAMLRERDHGLSEHGIEQCRALRKTIADASAKGDADAVALAAPDRVTCSSPLCRAILTAHLSLPPTPNQRMLTLPSAREHCFVPLFSRDSEGMLAAGLEAHVQSELARAPPAPDGSIDALPPPTLDLSRLGDGPWWTVGESAERVAARLGDTLRELVAAADEAAAKAAADGSSTPPVVALVGHSHAIRRMLSTYAAPSFAASAEGQQLCSRLIANCAVVRVTLEDDPEAPPAGASARGLPPPPRITHGALLFGTTFRDDK